MDDLTKGNSEPEPEPGPPRVPWGVGEALLVLLAVYVLAALWAVVRPLLDETGRVSPETLTQWTLPLVFLIMGVAPLVWMALRHRAGVRRVFGKLEHPFRTLGVGLVLGVGAFVLTRLALAALLIAAGGGEIPELPDMQPEYREMARDPVLSGWFLVTVVLIAPAAEEILFRGIIFQALRDRLGIWPGIGVSALLFTLLHLTQATLEANLLVFVLIFPLGMFLAWIFQRRRSLMAPVAVHAAYNLVGVALFRFAG